MQNPKEENPQKPRHYAVVMSDGVIQTVISINMKSFRAITPGQGDWDCIELSELETLWITHNHHKETLWYDKANKKVMNSKGEVDMLFTPVNGNAISLSVGDKSKSYVDSVSPEEAKEFLDTMKEIKEKEKEIQELYKKVERKTEELQKRIHNHVNVITILHDKLCRPLAISGYNEFKNKIHVEKDGRVFIVDKDIEITLEDLED